MEAERPRKRGEVIKLDPAKFLGFWSLREETRTPETFE